MKLFLCGAIILMLPHNLYQVYPKLVPPMKGAVLLYDERDAFKCVWGYAITGTDDTVRAMATGKILGARKYGRGKWASLKNAYFWCVYYNIKKMLVDSGAQVMKGQPIGLSDTIGIRPYFLKGDIICRKWAAPKDFCPGCKTIYYGSFN